LALGLQQLFINFDKTARLLELHFLSIFKVLMNPYSHAIY